MRNIDRIDPFIERLKEVWKQHPDLRFGQIVAFIELSGSFDDIFYVEDDKIFEILKRISQVRGGIYEEILYCGGCPQFLW